MEQRPLFHGGLNVSVLGLGTMTWGEQNTEAEAHAQLDWAVGHGINFVDTAEMYPVPPRPETGMRTETILGHWLARPGNRSKIVLASKVAGPGRYGWIRGGETRLTRRNIIAACEASLKRLRTDYIDLYQLHWPDRNVPAFGSWQFDPSKEREHVPIAEQIEALETLRRAGKIRAYGLSNETAWGLTMFCREAERLGAAKPASIQNAYSLLNRVFEGDLAEASYREQVPLLAYSPLAMGVLTGKYARGALPPGSRFARFPDFGGRYRRPLALLAGEEYASLARRHGLAPLAMALAFVVRRPFVASVLIGATSIAQLEEQFTGYRAQLDEGLLAEIEQISARYLHPAA
ncbi:MAG: aldo/keto reductase [Casimicrobiaceae bacterium]|nr:aldo/keto reductase [Casimicrobiaceae bacterium]MDW8311888.1 aldo/keto reductase [Burkholderiales bacterium]